MPSRSTLLAMLVAAALVTTGAAQTKPDFSGDWVYDQSKSTVVRVNNQQVDAPALGRGFSARQDATTLRVERTFGSPPTAYTWTFDLTGKPTTNKLPGQNGDDEVMSIATWQGNKLVIMSNRMSKDSQGRSMVTSSLTRTLSMSADGTLTIQASGTPPPLPKTSKVMSVYRPGAER